MRVGFERIPPGSDTLYGSVTTLSGTNQTNTGISYTAPFPMTGEDGEDAPGLPTNEVEVEFMFVPDQTNQTVTSTRPAGKSANRLGNWI